MYFCAFNVWYFWMRRSTTEKNCFFFISIWNNLFFVGIFLSFFDCQQIGAHRLFEWQKQNTNKKIFFNENSKCACVFTRFKKHTAVWLQFVFFYFENSFVERVTHTPNRQSKTTNQTDNPKQQLVIFVGAAGCRFCFITLLLLPVLFVVSNVETKEEDERRKKRANVAERSTKSTHNSQLSNRNNAKRKQKCKTNIAVHCRKYIKQFFRSLFNESKHKKRARNREGNAHTQQFMCVTSKKRTNKKICEIVKYKMKYK